MSLRPAASSPEMREPPQITITAEEESPMTGSSSRTTAPMPSPNLSTRPSRPQLAFREPSVRIRRSRAATDAALLKPQAALFSIAESTGPPTPSQLENGQAATLSPENTTAPDEGESIGRARSSAAASDLSSHPYIQGVRPRSATTSTAGSPKSPSAWRFPRRMPSMMSSRSDQQDDVRSIEDAASLSASDSEHYPHAVIDLLDVLDPEVSTISTLSNVQNSLFIPNLGSYLPSRRTTVDLSRNPIAAQVEKGESHAESRRARADSRASARPPSIISNGRPATPGLDDATLRAVQGDLAANETPTEKAMRRLSHAETLRGEYAVLPDDLDWSDWTEEEKEELDDYVRHLLHSKKERAKRTWKGFLKYASRPLGLFVTVYATLITLWGLAWVLFLIGWIYVGDRQDYIIEVIDQVLTALFCVVGIGMAPFRAVDTYHMIYIAMYHSKTVRLWKEQGRELPDENDLPHDDLLQTRPLAERHQIHYEESPLRQEEYAKFIHHQAVFCKSHTFYKPHETFTHKAFRLDLMIVIVCLLDCHSLFQMALGGTTWGIYYRNRPKALTAVILSFSICCNVTAGIIISVGDRLSRKKEVLEKRMHQAITAEAIHRKNLEQKLALRENTDPDDWMNAASPKTIKDIIKHKVEGEEKYSEKKAQQVVAAPVTGDISGPSSWAWKEGNDSTDHLNEKDKKRHKEDKKREEKLKLERVAAAHGKSLESTYEKHPLGGPAQKEG